MFTNIIQIGNSKGVRISKDLLILSGLENEVELKVKRGEIKIVPARSSTIKINDTTLLSEKSLGTDWDRPEEEDAWSSLQ